MAPDIIVYTGSALTQLRPGEGVSFTRTAGVHGQERRRRRRRIRGADVNGLSRRSCDDHQRPRASRDSTSRRCALPLPPPKRDEVAEERIRGVREAALQLADRDLAQNIRLQHERVGFAVERREQVRRRKLAGFNHRTHRAGPVRTADATSFRRRPAALTLRARSPSDR